MWKCGGISYCIFNTIVYNKIGFVFVDGLLGGRNMLQMDKENYIEFYKNTVSEYGIHVKKLITVLLEKEHKISFDEQTSLEDKPYCKYYKQRDISKIVKETVLDSDFLEFYNQFDFFKMYKYSVPFFFEGNVVEAFNNLIEKGIVVNSKKSIESYIIASGFDDVVPVYHKSKDGNLYIKFVFQKHYFKDETVEQVNYRYTIVVYIDVADNIIDIRYDSLKRYHDSKTAYEANLENILIWIKENLQIKLFKSDSSQFLDVVNQNEADVTIFKQMMDMGKAGQAELTASKDTDYILPFVGELRELIDENKELFEDSPEIRKLLEDYLNEKEVTASYPYVYLMWKNAIITKQFIVKVTFSFFENCYIQLQHITGNCTDVRMERMNDAIRYFSSSGAFIKGEEI